MLKKDVLRGKSNFSKIYNKGKSIGGRFVVIFYLKNDLPYNRFAFLASKKVGNSVKRNRARRLMKESIRLLDLPIGPGYDVIFIARNTISQAKCIDVQKSIEKSLKKTGVITK